eukprot:1596199-Rhodomonas_salina.1
MEMVSKRGVGMHLPRLQHRKKKRYCKVKVETNVVAQRYWTPHALHRRRAYQTSAGLISRHLHAMLIRRVKLRTS